MRSKKYNMSISLPEEAMKVLTAYMENNKIENRSYAISRMIYNSIGGDYNAKGKECAAEK